MVTEHTYSLNDSRGKAWLSLIVKSRAPSPKTLPLFVSGDEIQGQVSVDLEKSKNCKGVVIEVSDVKVLFLLRH